VSNLGEPMAGMRGLEINSGRLAKIKNGSGNSIASYSYDELSRKTAVYYYNGTSILYEYDIANNVRKVTNTYNGSSTVFGYPDFDKVGNRKCMKINSSEYCYDYDKLYQLTGADYPGGSASYGYDKLGVRTSMTNGSTTTYNTNNLNQLLSWDLEDHVTLYDDNGNLLRKFVYGAGIDEPACMIAGASTYYYHYDGLGSVIALSDSSKNIVGKYSYDVFGIPTIRGTQGEVRSTSAYGNPFLFTGRQYDAQAQLYYYRARFYSPVFGRFLQPDPIDYEDGLNLYTYVGNNPTNWIDPWGEASIGATPAGWPVGPMGKAAYGDTIYGQHWQILYNDGSDSGYFGGGSWSGFGGSPVFGPDMHRSSRNYRKFLDGLDDDLLKKAERIVQKKWRKQHKRYHPLNHSCQTYVLDVLREYWELQREQQEQQKQECNKKGAK